MWQINKIPKIPRPPGNTRAGEGTRDEASYYPESVHFEQKQEDIQNLSFTDQ